MKTVQNKTQKILKLLSPSFNTPQYIGNIIAIVLISTIALFSLSILPNELGNLNIAYITTIAKKIFPFLLISLALFFMFISVANEPIDEDGTLNQFNHDLYPEMTLTLHNNWKTIYPINNPPYDHLYVTKETDKEHLHHLHLKGYKEPILIYTNESRFLIMDKNGVKTVTTLLNPIILNEKESHNRESILHYTNCTTKTLQKVEVADVTVTITSGKHKYEFVTTTGRITYYETLNTSEYLQHKRKEAKILNANKIKNELEKLITP